MTTPTHVITWWLDDNGKSYPTIELMWDEEYISLTPEVAHSLMIEINTALKEVKNEKSYKTIRNNNPGA